VNRALWLAFAACGAPAQTAPIANTPAATAAIEPAAEPDVTACRALVAKEYDDGYDERTDASGNKIIITTSDVCGLVIQPILFRFNSAQVETDAADQMASMLACTAQTEGTKYHLEVIGHATADEHDPDRLALARANAVVTYFTACGVPLLGLKASSAGAREPLDSDDPEHARAISRRIQYVILERSQRP
jgi:outer membrane protein OmpA-like peptidoglycan-associated protein